MKDAKIIFLWATLAALPALPLAAATGSYASPNATPSDERVKMGVDAWQAGNYASAVTIWRPLALAGNPDAQFNLAQAYRLGHGVSSDPQTAMGWYKKAAAQDHEQAQATYGLMLFQSGDQKSAMPWLQKAADHGDPRALYVVGTALFNGDQLSKDWVRAYAMMTRAAAAGLPQARTSLGEMDRYIPASQRQQGTQLAQKMETGAPPTAIAMASPSPAAPRPAPRQSVPERSAPERIAPARPAPTPIRTTELPPSTPPAARPVPKTVQLAAKSSAPPAKAPPPPAKAEHVADSGWRVQLGAYSNAQKARHLWEGLSHRIAPLAGKQPYLVKAGAVTRLQAGPFPDRAAANTACAAAKAAKQDCFATHSG